MMATHRSHTSKGQTAGCIALIITLPIVRDWEGRHHARLAHMAHKATK